MRETMRRLKNSKSPEKSETKHLEDELFEKLCPRHKPTVEPNARKLFLRHEPVVDPLRAKNTQSAFDLAKAKVNNAPPANSKRPSTDDLEQTSCQKQHAAILEAIKQLEYTRMSVPVGGIKKIKEICMPNDKANTLFKCKTSFETAWKKGHHLFKMENHDSSAKRGK